MSYHNKQKVNESMYNAIKLMLKGGASNAEIARYMNLSDSTVSNIKRSENYEDYKQLVYMTSGYYRRKMMAINAKEEAEKEQKKEEVPAPVSAPVTEQKPIVQTVTIQATHYMMEEMRKTNELLKLISNKLAFIVDELTGVKHDA